MKNLFKLVAIIAFVGILAGCRKTEEVAKDSPDATHVVSKSLNDVYNGVTIGENTMPEGARAKADSIAAQVATPAK